MSKQGFYSDSALKLVKEAHRTRDPPTVPSYRTDLIRDSLLESKHLSQSLKVNSASSALNLLALKRSKRCILAYQRERINRLINLWWENGASTSTVLPENTHPSPSEAAFIKDYQKIVTNYKGKWLDIDLGASLLPPKDLFVEIRVLDDCGMRMTENGPIQLNPGSQHYVLRTDVEDLILSGAVQHVSFD